MGEDQAMVEKVEVLFRAVSEVRLQYQEDPATSKNPVNLGEAFGHLLTTLKMFVYVAGKDGVYRSCGNHGQIGAIRHDGLHVLGGIGAQILFIDIEGQLLRRPDTVYEVAVARA